MDIPVPTTQFTLGSGNSIAIPLAVSPYQLQDDPNHPGYLRDGFYTLTFTVQNVDGPYPGYWSAEIDFGTQELGSQDGWASQGPTSRSPNNVPSTTTITMVCPAPHYIVQDQALPGGGPVQGQQPFVLNFSSGPGPFWPVNFNIVSFTYTPETRVV
jgi:hypothetical protein